MGRVGLFVCYVGVAGCGRVGFNAPQIVSCTGLAATCGPTGTSPCCESSLVSGGTFYRSYDLGSDGMFTDMSSPASVSDFQLDTYEVTVGRFRQFVNAGLGTQTSPPSTGAGARTLNGMPNQAGWDPTWNASLLTDTTALVAAIKCAATQTWTDAPGANEALPIVCISWFEAFAFCAWDGGFLPTEAEWNYAAAGGAEQRAYPWSNPPSSLAIDCSHANYMNGSAYCVNPPTGGLNRVGSESPVGDGKYGQADLAGNASEWTLDWYQTPYASPCDDCSDLASGSNRAIRGGAFDNAASSLRDANRDNVTPTFRHSIGLGARCARAP